MAKGTKKASSMDNQEVRTMPNREGRAQFNAAKISKARTEKDDMEAAAVGDLPYSSDNESILSPNREVPKAGVKPKNIFTASPRVAATGPILASNTPLNLAATQRPIQKPVQSFYPDPKIGTSGVHKSPLQQKQNVVEAAKNVKENFNPDLEQAVEIVKAGMTYEEQQNLDKYQRIFPAVLDEFREKGVDLNQEECEALFEYMLTNNIEEAENYEGFVAGFKRGIQFGMRHQDKSLIELSQSFQRSLKEMNHVSAEMNKQVDELRVQNQTLKSYAAHQKRESLPIPTSVSAVRPPVAQVPTVTADYLGFPSMGNITRKEQLAEIYKNSMNKRKSEPGQSSAQGNAPKQPRVSEEVDITPDVVETDYPEIDYLSLFHLSSAQLLFIHKDPGRALQFVVEAAEKIKFSLSAVENDEVEKGRVKRNLLKEARELGNKAED